MQEWGRRGKGKSGGIYSPFHQEGKEGREAGSAWALNAFLQLLLGNPEMEHSHTARVQRSRKCGKHSRGVFPLFLSFPIPPSPPSAELTPTLPPLLARGKKLFSLLYSTTAAASNLTPSFSLPLTLSEKNFSLSSSPFRLLSPLREKTEQRGKVKGVSTGGFLGIFVSRTSLEKMLEKRERRHGNIVFAFSVYCGTYRYRPSLCRFFYRSATSHPVRSPKLSNAKKEYRWRRRTPFLLLPFPSSSCQSVSNIYVTSPPPFLFSWR